MAFYLLVDLQLAEKAQYRAYTQAHTAGERTSFSWRRFYNDARHRQIYFDNGRVRKRCEDSPHSKSTFVRNCERSISFRESFGSATRLRVAFITLGAGCCRDWTPKATLKSPDLQPSFCAARQAKAGAGDEARTRDVHLGKVVLYQLSYTRVFKSE